MHKRMLFSSRYNGKCIANWAVCFLLTLVPLFANAQNLVPNPRFELHDTCPEIFGFTSKPLYWNRWDQSPDYFHACAGNLGGIDTLLDVPWNGFTWQYAYDGDGYVGSGCFLVDDFHELVGAELIQPLVVGQTYYASFYTNLATEGSYWEARWACNNQGLLFTMNEHIWQLTTGAGPEFVVRNYAHVNNTTVITDTMNWTLVSGSFIADSAYRYVVIGNFFADAFTDTVHLSANPSIAAYYLFDAVCVSSDPNGCPMATSILDYNNVTQHVYVDQASGQLVIGGIQANSAYGLFDMSGRLFNQGEVNSGMISIADLPLGVYTLVIKLNNGESIREKFVYMH